MERTSVAFTIILLALSPAQAAHPSQKTQKPNQTAGHATIGKIVGTQVDSRGLVFVRQVVEPQPRPANARGSNRAKSRTIYMNREGVMLRPGLNNAGLSTSSIVSEPTRIGSWDIDDDTWAETMDCMTGMFSRFDVTVTDVDPGESVPHIEAVFGGHPNDLGLDSNVAGISPFATDCSIIEDSVVFTFTDVLDDNPQLLCEIMAQEIAHSYGLDHQLLAEDPMSYLEYEDDRTFQNADSECGEYDSRPCGIDGSVCWPTQNSVQMLVERLGVKGQPDTDTSDSPRDTGSDDDDAAIGGCSAGGTTSGAGAFGFVLALAALKRRRRART